MSSLLTCGKIDVVSISPTSLVPVLMAQEDIVLLRVEHGVSPPAQLAQVSTDREVSHQPPILKGSTVYSAGIVSVPLQI